MTMNKKYSRLCSFLHAAVSRSGIMGTRSTTWPNRVGRTIKNDLTIRNELLFAILNKNYDLRCDKHAAIVRRLLLLRTKHKELVF